MYIKNINRYNIMRDASLNLPKLISDKAKYQPKLQRVR